MRYKLIFMLLLFCFSINGQNKQDSYSKTEVDLKLELHQQTVEGKVNEINLQNQRISTVESQIANHSSNLTLFMTIISVITGVFAILVAFAAYFGYKRLSQKVKKDMKEIKKYKKEIENIKIEIKGLLDKSKDKVKAINDIEIEAKNIIHGLNNTPPKEQTAEKKQEVKEAVVQIDKKLTSFDWFLKGYKANMEGKHDEAAIYYKNATEINPNDADAYNNWGGALSDLAKMKQDEDLFKQSIEKYKKATELNPNYAVAYDNWGTALLQLATLENNWTKYKDEIIRLLNKAEEIELGSGSYNLACFYSCIGNTDEAFMWLEKALQYTGKSVDRKHVQKDDDLEHIRNDARFMPLVDKYFPTTEK